MDNRRVETKGNSIPSKVQLKSVLKRTIERMNHRLNPEKIKEIAQVFQIFCWNFKDKNQKAYLLLDKKGVIKYATRFDGEPDAIITLDSIILHNAAYNKTTLGTAFVMGKLKVKGISALRLRKFIPLLKPFLESYREAWEVYCE
jgi:alkyl sulfatase BDS1-like metallo-beta-lactamase superfamily hydrolase